MKKNRNSILNYFCWVLLAMSVLAACNRAEIEDPNPELGDTEQEAITTPESPTVINLLEGQTGITAQTEFELVGNTQNGGKAQFIGQGLLLYTPAESTTQSTDQVRCRRRNGADKPWHDIIIRIVIVKDANAMPCQLGAVPDFAFIPPSEASILIDVLANDRFCNNRPDSSSLQIAIQPVYGKAEVVPITSLSNRPRVRYSRTQNTPPAGGRDIFVYKIHEKNNSNNIGYGVVVVNYGNPDQSCRLKGVEDFLTMPPRDTTRKVIDVLRNDIFCPELMNWEEFKILVEPRYGNAQINSDRRMVYKLKKGLNIQSGMNDRIKYQIQYKDGRKDTANVWIRFDEPVVCPAVLPQANDDQYTFRADTIRFDRVFLPVLRNDRFCPPQFNPAKFVVTRKPEVGAAIVLNGVIQFIPPSNTWRGRVKFRYQICEGFAPNPSTCDDAEVEVEIKN
ncbi:MAG: hypothetical protein MUE85_23145 [Microscillaceae bacterium]|nr:hypothetical protein [Microscillaceae bacterium]